MKFLLFSLLLSFFLTACSTNTHSPAQKPQSQFGFAQDGANGETSAKIIQNGMQHEFEFIDFDKSESSLRFNAQIHNTSKGNKIFNVMDVTLVINSTKDNEPIEWKIQARDASLADKELLSQITDLENKQSTSIDMLASNFGPKKNRDSELKSIKERRKELAEKSFYTTNIVPDKVISGLMYFSITDKSFLTAPKTTMHILVKGSKSNDLVFNYKQVSTEY